MRIRLLRTHADSHSRGVITEINRNVAATLKLCGPAILAPSSGSSSTPLEKIAAHLCLILEKQHPCQKDEDDFEELEIPAEETAEYDWLVIETAMEVIAGLAVALGEQFGEMWKMFESLIIKYSSSQERFERSAAVGTMADCIEAMRAGCTPHTKRFMTIFAKRLQDEDPETKSNACFGTGLLCAHSSDAELASSYGPILQTLEPVLDPAVAAGSSADDSRARLVDNAAGCLARMVKARPHAVPLPQVLPRLVDLLPLKNDFRENEPVFDMLVALYQAGEPTVQGLTGQLMPVLEKVLGPPEEQISEATRGKLRELVEYLRK